MPQEPTGDQRRCVVLLILREGGIEDSVAFIADNADEILTHGQYAGMKIGNAVEREFQTRMEEMKPEVDEDEINVAMEDGYWEFGDTEILIHWPERLHR